MSRKFPIVRRENLPQPARTPASSPLQAKFKQGVALHQKGKLADAERIYTEVLKQQPNNFDAMHLLGVIALQTRRTQRGVELISKAIGFNAKRALAHNNLGNGLRDLNRLEDALASYDKAIALKPDFAEAYSNRGNALQELQRPEDALASCDKAIALKPDDAEANSNQSHCLLRMGRFEQGWRQYEWRKKHKEPIAARSFPQPLWSGAEDLEGKILFIHWEQGLGDTIQFCRYARLAEARGAKVVLSVQEPLRRLLTQLSPTVQIIGGAERPARFDYHSPLLSLPLAFATTRETIPAEIPYLGAEHERVENWKQRLGGDGFKIGICWQGKKGKIDIGRSFSLREFVNIAAVPDVRLISLQKNDGTEQLANLPEGMNVETLGADFDAGPNAFLDTAAVMEHMDLVITSDTATAHLAGALGRPTWVALKRVPDWRWLLEGSKSRWYPTMRLFRQKLPGEWKPVFDDMLKELTGRPELGTHWETRDP